MFYFSSLGSSASDLQTTLTMSNERILQVLFDTCSSLDLIDEDTAKRCDFPLRKSEKISFRVAGGPRVVSNMMATVSLPLTPTKNLERSVYVIKGLKVADVILGITFLCHENATINCAEKRVVSGQ